MEDNNKKRYSAFISYRHCEPDSYVAKTLQKKLETLKIPKNIKSNTSLTSIERIFRDEDELPVAGSLSSQIDLALSESEYLICLCSPRYLESQWCMMEIETFIEKFGKDKILLVLVDGEPSESFPEVITKEEVKVIGPDGIETTQIRNCEPLAADVRATSQKERRKKIDDASLRLAAAMLGINYDDLKQRHRERIMKKVISGISTALVCLLMFAIFCIFTIIRIDHQAKQIQQQNIEIQQQNDVITEKSKEITDKNMELEAQYIALETKYSISVSEKSDDLLASGRIFDALYSLRHVLPDSMDDTSVPYTEESHFALTNVWDFYGKSHSFANTNCLDCDYQIESFTDNGNDFIAVTDANFNLTIYNILERNVPRIHKKVMKFNRSSTFITEDLLVYQSDDGKLTKYNIRTNEAEIIDEPNGDLEIFNNLTDKYFATLDSFNKILKIFDKTGNAPLYEINLDEYYTDDSFLSATCFDFSPNGKYFSLGLEFTFDYVSIFTLNLENKEITVCNDEFSFLTNLVVSDDCTAFVCYDNSSIEDNPCYVQKNLVNNEEIWKRDDLSGSYCMITDFITEDSTLQYLLGINNTVYIIDASDGNTVYEYIFESPCVYTDIVVDNIIIVILENAAMYCYVPNENMIQSLYSYNNSPKMTIADARLLDSGLILQPLNSSYISVYTMSLDLDSVTYELAPGNIIGYNKAGTYYIVKDYLDKDLYNYTVYDIYNCESLFSISSSYGTLDFVGDGSKEVVLLADEAVVFDIATGKRVHSIQPKEQKHDMFHLSSDKEAVYYFTEDGYLRIYSLENYKKTGEYDFKQPIKAKNLLVPNKDYAIFTDSSSPSIELYNLSSSKYICEANIGAGQTERLLISDDGKYLCAVYTNGNLGFYSIENSLERKQTLYSDYKNILSFKKVQNSDNYLISGNKSYFLSPNLKPVMNYQDCIEFVDMDECIAYTSQKFDSDSSPIIKGYPHYTYDNYIMITDYFLEDYVPSETTKELYNILN